MSETRPSTGGHRPRLALHGAGRMGRQLAEASESAGFSLVGVIARHQPDWLTEDLYAASPEQLVVRPDVIIDFSLPGGAASVAQWCAGNGVPLVSGTTGLDETARAELDTASAKIPLLWAANFSIGLNACLVLAKRLRELVGTDAPARILDIHHAGKLDAPSGTALVLGEAIGGDVEYDSVREGDAIGEHHLVLELADEQIEIRHVANDRRLFALGALHAARWLCSRSPGRYTMLDCIDAATP
ncbi:4-hydroxy-tetrahydrodipicolinate reductase [Marinihelvus fidelis]|uniref:4-hydroxy-tetrahydrodipicolinate reductase n=1 Tax=Marinihelvus fidelis TaxID=2613842 RepID=A0A5N0TFF7_9GAMM|nr:dihydrodipicolinate reductase C-terminal domain-containing protein [Marinihelvus fidelis]KAA9133204.1 4-hydroxy-tetrahydrodipicolinate reductase [Marinihelvus fidelis]